MYVFTHYYLPTRTVYRLPFPRVLLFFQKHNTKLSVMFQFFTLTRKKTSAPHRVNVVDICVTQGV